MAEPLNDRYIVLPSNVKPIDGDSVNRPNHFKTPLDRPLELEKDKWEVALAEINYPHSWLKSVNTSYLWYQFSKKTYTWGAPPPIRVDHARTVVHEANWQYVETKHVASKQIKRNRNILEAKEIIKYLNSMKPKEFDGRFTYGTYEPGNKERRVMVFLRDGEMLYLSPSLRTLLGFNNGYVDIVGDNSKIKLTNPKSKIDHLNPSRDKNPSNQIFRVVAPQKPDFQESKYNLYIYCNLVNNTIVGDTQVPLLRTVAVNNKNQNKYVSEHFQDLRYMPLASNFYQYIEIQITDDYGELIDFQSGKVIVTLHLRQKNR